LFRRRRTPPPHRLVDLLPPGVATGEHLPELVDEEVDLSFLQSHLGGQVGEEIVEDLGEIGLIAGETRGQLDRGLAVEGELDLVVSTRLSMTWRWSPTDPAHGVGDVSVETWKEPESVLAGEMAAGPLHQGTTS
jgi:hypothetical protein